MLRLPPPLFPRQRHQFRESSNASGSPGEFASRLGPSDRSWPEVAPAQAGRGINRRWLPFAAKTSRVDATRRSTVIDVLSAVFE